jgi:hypothetical protein
MPRRQLSPEQLQEIRDFAAQWGKIVARRAFGDAGPDTAVDFQAMEDIARAAAAGVAEGTLDVLLSQQADALGAQQPCPDCGRLCSLRRQDRPLSFHGGQLVHREPVCHCPDCRRVLRLDGHGYSPAVLQMIVEAGGHFSFSDAALALRLAGVSISPRHIRELTVRIGTELAAARDAQAVAHRRRQLEPEAAPPAEVVATVEVDGGRLRTRAEGCGPGVHQAQHKEDKIACLVSLPTPTHADDPQPEPPPAFTQPRRVQRLVQKMKGLAGEQPADEDDAADDDRPPRRRPEPAPPGRVRTCLASLKDSRSFAPLLAAAAQRRGFYQAARRAFVADGQAYNWVIHRGYFPDFEAIADFLHVLCYVYLAAWAVGGSDAQRWSVYLEWMRACWQGRVEEVLAALAVWQAQLGQPPPDEGVAENDPRRLVAEALTYLGNNRGRMAYPRYRREGLPVTSSLVESLVGEFNDRVKGREKFWNRPEGAEAILQVRAALLSDDGGLAHHFAQRQGSPYRRRQAG